MEHRRQRLGVLGPSPAAPPRTATANSRLLREPSPTLATLAVGATVGCRGLSDRAYANRAVFDTCWEALAASDPYFASKHSDWRAMGASYSAAGAGR